MADLLTIRPEARDEWRRLVAALDVLEAAGRQTPCQMDPEPFGSEDRAERREAASSCAWCPLLEVCGAFAEANAETANVWAGVDRTVHPKTVQRRRRGWSRGTEAPESGGSFQARRPPDPYTQKLTSSAVPPEQGLSGVTPQGGEAS